MVSVKLQENYYSHLLSCTVCLMCQWTKENWYNESEWEIRPSYGCQHTSRDGAQNMFDLSLLVYELYRLHACYMWWNQQRNMKPRWWQTLRTPSEHSCYENKLLLLYFNWWVTYIFALEEGAVTKKKLLLFHDLESSLSLWMYKLQL